MSKLFKIAGVSLHKGKWSVRYANDKGRAAVLARSGHTSIELYAFKEALAKEDLVDQLLDMKLKGAAGEAVRAEAQKLGFIV